MKRILFVILLLATLTQAMEQVPFVTTGMPEGRKQAELINALDKGDKAQIDKLLDAGTVNKPFGLFGYRGHTPLTVALVGQFGAYRPGQSSNREATARYLISKGADPAPLNPYLQIAAKHGEAEKVKFLLSFGAQDINDKSLEEATDTYNDYLKENYDPEETARYGKVIEQLKQAKRKSQWAKKPIPSKGIFQELETEEFLKPVAQPK
ncbi:hypothetical protein BH09DEP1_BH09DEP1_4140 [soil metagenome]